MNLLYKYIFLTSVHSFSVSSYSTFHCGALNIKIIGEYFLLCWKAKLLYIRKVGLGWRSDNFQYPAGYQAILSFISNNKNPFKQTDKVFLLKFFAGYIDIRTDPSCIVIDNFVTKFIPNTAIFGNPAEYPAKPYIT